METLTTPAYRTISNHVIAERRQKLSNEQNALFALQSFQPGEVIADFSAGTIAAEPTYLTVQVGIGKHITLQPEFLQYINHSCEPNVFFNTTTMQLVALKEIQQRRRNDFLLSLYRMENDTIIQLLLWQRSLYWRYKRCCVSFKRSTGKILPYRFYSTTTG